MVLYQVLGQINKVQKYPDSREKFMSDHTRKPHRLLKLVMAFLAALVVVLTTVFIFLRPFDRADGQNQSESELSPEEQAEEADREKEERARNNSNAGTMTELDPDYSDTAVTDEASARESIAGTLEESGIDSADDLGSCRINSFDGVTSYRFAQQYNGIPVYGRDIIVNAADNGQVLGLTGNYMDLSEYSFVPVISEEEALSAAASYIDSDSSSFISEGLSIYTLNDHEPVLTYKFITMQQIILISAGDGSLVLLSETVNYDAVTGRGKDTNNTERTVPLENYAGKFLMYDRDHRILMLDAQKKLPFYGKKQGSLSKLFAVGEDGVLYECSNSNYKHCAYPTSVTSEDDFSWIDSYSEKDAQAYKARYNRNTVSLTPESNEGTGREVRNPHFLWDYDNTSPLFVSGTDLSDKNLKLPVQLYYECAVAQDFFRKDMRINANADETVTVVFNCSPKGDNGKKYNPSNAGATGFFVDGHKFQMILCIENYKMAIDAMGHEYGHRIVDELSGTQYQGEPGALNEGIADIMGECVQDYEDDGSLNGTCDFISFDRYGTDPVGPEHFLDLLERTHYPAVYKGEYWQHDTSNTADDDGGVHHNSTVIFHAAYLMTQNYEGAEFEALSQREMANLFVRTLMMMPSQCSYPRCAAYIRDSARILQTSGRLTESQVRTVYRALEDCGLGENTSSNTRINLKSRVRVSGKKGADVRSFDVTVTGKDGTAYGTFSVDNDAYVDLEISTPGVYKLLINPRYNGRPAKRFSKEITVTALNDKSYDRLNIETDWETDSYDLRYEIGGDMAEVCDYYGCTEPDESVSLFTGYMNDELGFYTTALDDTVAAVAVWGPSIHRIGGLMNGMTVDEAASVIKEEGWKVYYDGDMGDGLYGALLVKDFDVLIIGYDDFVEELIYTDYNEFGNSINKSFMVFVSFLIDTYFS